MQKHRIIAPVRRRYQSPIRLEFFNKGSRKAVAYAIYWLTDLIDNKETALSIPVYKTPMPKQMTQNYIANIEMDKIKADRVGTIKMTVRFKMGMDDTDEQWAGFGSELQQYTSVPSSIVSDDRESLNIQEDF